MKLDLTAQQTQQCEAGDSNSENPSYKNNFAQVCKVLPSKWECQNCPNSIKKFKQVGAPAPGTGAASHQIRKMMFSSVKCFT